MNQDQKPIKITIELKPYQYNGIIKYLKDWDEPEATKTEVKRFIQSIVQDQLNNERDSVHDYIALEAANVKTRD